jgi:hypothetical protein
VDRVTNHRKTIFCVAINTRNKGGENWRVGRNEYLQRVCAIHHIVHSPDYADNLPARLPSGNFAPHGIGGRAEFARKPLVDDRNLRIRPHFRGGELAAMQNMPTHSAEVFRQYRNDHGILSGRKPVHPESPSHKACGI